jgi:hypothetical protein
MVPLGDIALQHEIRLELWLDNTGVAHPRERFPVRHQEDQEMPKTAIF